MTISRTDKEIIIKLSPDLDIEEIQRVLTYLRYKEIAASSKASQADADQLAEAVNENWWAKNKRIFDNFGGSHSS
jgi:dihydroorotate dehydrogenase